MSLVIKNSSKFTDKEQDFLLKQYEILVDSIKSHNSLRESSNNFWVTVNGVTISAAAYIRDAQSFSGKHKYVLMWTLIALGVCLCTLWMSYLLTLKKRLDLENELLMELEQYFPAKIFITLLQDSKREKGGNSLTMRVILVPILFLLGYIFFAGLLLFFPGEVA